METEVNPLELKAKVYLDGIPRKKYWTPDGREIRAIPAWRDYNIIENGKRKQGGTRDANYDKGWLESPPQNPVPYCKYCDRWHDTQEEVDKCGKRQASFVAAEEQRQLAKHPELRAKLEKNSKKVNLYEIKFRSLDKIE